MPRAAVAIVAVLTGLAVASSSAAANPMVGKINKVRRAHGLSGLKESGSLAHSSKSYARFLMRKDWFGHLFPIRASKRRFNRLGEALAMFGGWRPRKSFAIRSWLRSPPHRALLLSRTYSHVGVERAKGRFRGRRATIWVAHFGRRR
jgi:uncharacterized protein YkwD